MPYSYFNIILIGYLLGFILKQQFYTGTDEEKAPERANKLVLNDGSGMVFNEDGRAVFVAGHSPSPHAFLFFSGTMLRRDLIPEDQIIAGRWAGAPFDENGQPIWDEQAERFFADGYTEHVSPSIPSDKPYSKMEKRPALTAEFTSLLDRYRG